MALAPIGNGDSGVATREKMNAIIDAFGAVDADVLADMVAAEAATTAAADRAEAAAALTTQEDAWGAGSFEIKDASGNVLVEIDTTTIDHPDTNAMREVVGPFNPTEVADAWADTLEFKDESGNVLLRVTPTQIFHPAIDDLGTAPTPIQRSDNAFAAFGDSRVATIYEDAATNKRVKSTRSFFNFANALMGQRMRLVGHYAVSGNRSDEYLSTDKVDAALATNAGWFIIFGTVNDIAQLYLTPFTDAIKPVCERIIGEGGKVILCTEPGAGNYNSTQSAAVQLYNAQIRRYARERAGVVLFDLAAVTVLPTATPPVSFPAGYSIDGIHYITPATLAQGQAFAALMSPLVPANDHLIASAMENTTNGALQFLPNPLFLTTSGGTASSGGSGTIPASWVVGAETGITAASSVVATDYGNEVVLTITASKAGVARLSCNMDALEAVGDELYGMARVRVDAGHSNLATVMPRLESSRTTTNSAFDLFGDLTTGVLPAGAHDFTVETAGLTILSGTRNYLNFQLRAQFVDAGSAVVRISRASVRKLVSI